MELKAKYRVSLYRCPANLPFFFAIHPWFVVEIGNTVTRWEVGFRSYASATNWNHLYKDLLPPFKGIGIFPYSFAYLWEGQKVASIEGEENSTAERMAKFIQDSPNIYPFCNEYSLSGPNSNTYVQWVLNNFPEFKVKLPWNAIGKSYVR